MIKRKAEPFTLPALPYELNALEPYLSARTVEVHYQKHHQGYVNQLNELVSDGKFSSLTLEEILVKTAGDANHVAIFHNAAQVWNHNFYWKSLSPLGGKKPSGELARKIEISFGSYENFIKEFAEAGVDQFGSGWVWLVKEHGLLKIMKTANASNPLSRRHGTPLLVLDVWEHAYYLDYQNRRKDYLAILLDKLLNWSFAEENLHLK